MKSKFVKNFSLLALSLFAIKLLGGIYRIPLANLLDAEGMGLYQMVFPLYTLFLTMTSSALPSAISKLVSDSKHDEQKVMSIYKTARVFVMIGSAIASIVLIAFSLPLAKMQGNISAQLPYMLIAPSIFFVGGICLYRGVYQGKLDMKPTAISQIVEQVVKIAFGLLLAYIFRSNIFYAVLASILAVTVSEVVTFIYLKVRAKKVIVKNIGVVDLNVAKELLSLFAPMTLAFSLTPLITTVESRLILSNVFSQFGGLADFGLYQGCAVTLVGLPIALISALGVVLIPYLENSKKDVLSISMRFSLVVLPLFAIAFFFFASNISNTLFSSFGLFERNTLANLVRFSSLTVILQGLNVLTTSTLYGMKRARIPLITLFIGGALKILTILLWLPKYGIIVAVISDWVCYSVALILNLIYIISKRKISLGKGALLSLVTLYAVCTLEMQLISQFIFGMLGIIIAVLIVSLTIVAFAVFAEILTVDEKKDIFGGIFKRRIKNDN